MAEPPPLPVPPKGRKFPCRQCGAKLDFDPAARGLKCPYCGFTDAIPEADDEERNKVREHDLEEFLESQEERADAVIEGHAFEVRCDGCGAVVMLDDSVITENCPYCSTYLENKPHAVEHLIAPESLLPFRVGEREARDAFVKWVHGLWFAPTELKRLANLGQFKSVYAPFWTYDAMTYTQYTGQRGDDYWATESIGGGKTRSVRRTRWSYASGEVQQFFNDVLIRASDSMPRELVAQLPPWGLGELEPFRDEFLSGHVAERYSLSLRDGYHLAQGVMENDITRLIQSDIGGDRQRISERSTLYVGVTFKHTLLPVWVANYRYRERRFLVLVNGRTAKVSGRRPWSWWKIAGVTTLAILAILLVAAVVMNLSR